MKVLSNNTTASVVEVLVAVSQLLWWYSIFWRFFICLYGTYNIGNLFMDFDKSTLLCIMTGNEGKLVAFCWNKQSFYLLPNCQLTSQSNYLNIFIQHVLKNNRTPTTNMT